MAKKDLTTMTYHELAEEYMAVLKETSGMTGNGWMCGHDGDAYDRMLMRAEAYMERLERLMAVRVREHGGVGMAATIGDVVVATDRNGQVDLIYNDDEVA